MRLRGGAAKPGEVCGGNGNGSANAREEGRRGECYSPGATASDYGDICIQKKPTAQLAVPLERPLLGKNRDKVKIWLLILNTVLLLLRK